MNKRASFFVNGEMADADFALEIIKEDDWVVAVDGGLRHLLGVKLLPHLLIGDLDSISTEELEAVSQKGIEVLRFPEEKDETDLELALMEAASREYKTILVAGALGGRIDQLLANLSLLLLPELVGLNVRIIDRYQEIFLIRDRALITGQAGDIVSLLPLKGSAEGISTTGLKYSLSDETLFLEHSRGISNQMNGSHAQVSLMKGCLLCIHSWFDRRESL
jgi:thiamine pyrophosphokinase